MARAKNVEITLINNAKYFVPAEVFETFGVPETADGVIGSYIAGSRGPILKVNTLVGMNGETHYINPRHIASFKITYL